LQQFAKDVEANPPSTSAWLAETLVSATYQRITRFCGYLHCTKVLLNVNYARVSTNDQETATQVPALKAAECERIYREKASGGRWDRPELHRLLDQLRKGDVLVVWKLDRLSRSLRDVLTIMERLSEAGAGFRSLTEAIDTTTAAGRMMMQMVGAFAEFERAMLRERTKAGLDSARREGRIGGHRPKLSPQQQAEIRKMVSKGHKTAAGAARLFKVHPATVSRLLARAYAK
jgi:DNA invertase Pin-like site-specific DNA recombinase